MCGFGAATPGRLHEYARPASGSFGSLSSRAEVALFFATTENGVHLPLQTTLVSTGELTAQLTKQVWGEKDLQIKLDLIDQTGKKTESIRFVKKTVPSVTIQQGSSTQSSSASQRLNSLEPSSFFSSQTQAFLLNQDGSPNSDTFAKNEQGFQVEIVDPTAPDFSDPANARVTLISTPPNASTSTPPLDKNAYIPLQVIPTDPGRFRSSDSQIVTVTTRIDDGKDPYAAVGSSTAQAFFSPNDGSGTDQTILSQPGGTVKVLYENIKHGIHLEKQEIPVCDPSVQRKAVVHILNVDGSGLQDSAVQALVPEMQKIWAQWCVDIQTDVAHLTPPHTNLVNPHFQGSYVLPPFTYTITTPLPDGTVTTQTKTVTLSSATGDQGMSQDTIDLISQARPQATAMTSDANGEILILIIDHFQGLTTPINGITLTDTRLGQGGVALGPRALPRGYGGVIFLTTNATATGTTPFQMDSKTIAHELAHMILDTAHSDQQGVDQFGAFQCPASTCDKRNLLSGTGGQPDNNLLRRRFTAGQIQRIRNNHSRHLHGVN